MQTVFWMNTGQTKSRIKYHNINARFLCGHFFERKHMYKKKKNSWTKISPYLYITPISAILLLFVVGSVIISVMLGFTKYNIITAPVFEGLDNYTRLFSDGKFVKSLFITLKLIAVIVPLQTVLGILVSAFLVANRKRFLGKLANAIIFIPVLCADAVVGVVWREMLNGKIPVVEAVFGSVGIDPSLLLGSGKTALIVVGMVAVWKNMGYFAVIYSSGLLGISQTYYEAAKADGAGAIKCFFMITLPMLKPTIIMAVFLSLTNSLRCFDLIYNLTGGGPNNATTTLVLYAYNTCFGGGRAGYAMAISNALFAVILLLVLMQSRMMKRETSEI